MKKIFIMVTLLFVNILSFSNEKLPNVKQVLIV